MTPPRVSTAAYKHTDAEVISSHESGRLVAVAVENTSFQTILHFRVFKAISLYGNSLG
jgi:hypothetical protein